MTYKVDISEAVEKNLRKISKKIKNRIIEEIDGLSENPRPKNCKKLQGSKKPPLFRIRVGDYRIIYTVRDKVLIVLVVDIGHRKEIYR